MAGFTPRGRWFLPLLCLALLTSCQRAVGTWGKNTLTRSEFDAFLDDRSEGYRATATFSDASMGAACRHALSNRVLAFEARRLGLDRLLPSHPGFTNALLTAVGAALDRSWTPSDRQLTVDLVKRHATIWNAEALYLLGRCDSNRVPDGPTAGLLARLEPAIRAASNLETFWEGLPKDHRTGFTRLEIGWTTSHWRYAALAESTPKGAVAAPIFQDAGVLFLRFGAPQVPAADELNQSMKRDDFRRAIRGAVRTRRVQEFRAQLQKEGRRESDALLSLTGDSSFRAAMARFTNDFLAEHFVELAERERPAASGPEGSARVAALFNRFPLEVFPAALPPAFTQEKRGSSSEKLPTGSLFFRLIDRLRHPTAQARWEAGERELGQAAELRRGAPPPEGRLRLEKKVGAHAETADRLLAGAFRAGLASHDRAWKTAEAFLRISDYPRARQWMLRALAASGLDRDALRDRLFAGRDGTECLLLTEAMGASGDESWIPVLMELLRRGGTPNDLQCFALEALGRLPDRGQARFLEPFYRDPGRIWGVRLMAAQSLEKLTGRKYPVENPAEPSGGVKHP
ncbi:MAG: hypothetical protein J0L75_00950 [Spirochaetes bacterium]|nr:hypothetical protein [Spirochaetota bacterium]